MAVVGDEQLESGVLQREGAADFVVPTIIWPEQLQGWGVSSTETGETGEEGLEGMCL